MYLQNIMKRSDDELVRRVYSAQKANPVSVDFSELIQWDFKLLGVKLTENEIMFQSKESLKTEIKAKAMSAAFKYLSNKQQQHSKVREIMYPKLQTQPYIVSPFLKNDEVNFLYALRSRMVNVRALSKLQF